MTPRPVDLPALWRDRAKLLQPYAPGVARAFEEAADALDGALVAADGDLLDLRAAAEASGYSVDHLARLVRDGTVPNAGRPRSPRIRRGDLPQKPGGLARTGRPRDLLGASSRQIATAVITAHPRGQR